MTRRQFCAAPAFVRTLGTSRPHLLLLMDDQHRGDWLGCETKAIHTPNLDALAGSGVRFRHAYSSTPSCTPARAALLTGMSPWRHGLLGYGPVAQRYPVELPRLLGEAGYHTSAIGKLHYTPQRNLHGFHEALLDESGRVESADFRSDYRSWFAMEAPGLDADATGIGWNDNTAKPYALPERLHPTRWTGDCAVRYLESYQRAQPFFLKVSFARPHSPYDAPQRWWDYYGDKALPKPVLGDWAGRFIPKSSAADDMWHGECGLEHAMRARRGYAGSVSFVDEQVGRIVEALEKRKMRDETLIVFLSDHGDMLGDHHLWRKTYGYEGSARIPMLVSGPGIAKGQVNRTPVEIRDVAPTLLAAAGVAVPQACDGVPLLKARREWIDLEHYVCYDRTNDWTGLTDGRWKYIRSQYDQTEQLFDLAQGEARLSADEAQLRLWRGRMDAHLEPRAAAGARALKSPNYPKA